jgi:raffinose/stachyose/melibiose transport system permease protein
MLRAKMNKGLFYALIGIIAVFWVTPLLFLVLTAVKEPSDFYVRSPFALPNAIRWRNFTDGFVKSGLGIFMKNSSVICLIKVPLGIFIEALAAFALTRLNLKRNNLIFMFFLIGMMIPMQVTLVPLNVMLTKYKLINTYLGIIIVYLGFGLSFGILVLRGFMRSLPGDLDEAARIDGCGNFRLFLSIILPNTKPALSSLLIIDFLATWNEYLLSNIFLNEHYMRMVPAGLMAFFGQFGVDYTLLSASVIISVIPVLVVYLYFQKYFVEGMAGSIKG